MEKLSQQVHSISSYLESQSIASKIFEEFAILLANSFKDLMQKTYSNIIRYKDELRNIKEKEDGITKNSLNLMEIHFKNLSNVSLEFGNNIEHITNEISGENNGEESNSINNINNNNNNDMVQNRNKAQLILETLKENKDKLSQKKVDYKSKLKKKEEEEKKYNEGINNADPNFLRNFNKNRDLYDESKRKCEEAQNKYKHYLEKVESSLNENTEELEKIFSYFENNERKREKAINDYLIEIIKTIDKIVPSLLELKTSIEPFQTQKVKNAKTIFQSKSLTLFYLDKKLLFTEVDLNYHEPSLNVPANLSKSESFYLVDSNKDSFSNFEQSPNIDSLNMPKAKSLTSSEFNNTEQEEIKDVLSECLRLLIKNEMISNKEEILGIMKKPDSMKIFSEVISKYDIPFIFTDIDSFTCFKDIIICYLDGLLNDNLEERFGMFYQVIMICKETWKDCFPKTYLFSLVKDHIVWEDNKLWIPTIELILESRGAKPGLSVQKIRQSLDFEYNLGLFVNFKRFAKKSYKMIKKLKVFKKNQNTLLTKANRNRNGNSNKNIQIVYEVLSFFAICFYIFEVPEKAAFKIIFGIATQYDLPFEKKEDLLIELSSLHPFHSFKEILNIEDEDLNSSKPKSNFNLKLKSNSKSRANFKLKLKLQSESPLIEKDIIMNSSKLNPLQNGHIIKKKNLELFQINESESLFEHDLKTCKILFLVFKGGFFDLRFAINSIRLSQNIYRTLRNKVYRLVLLNPNFNCNCNLNQKHEIRQIIWKIILGLHSYSCQNDYDSNQDLYGKVNQPPEEVKKSYEIIQLDIDRSYFHIKEIDKDIMLRILKKFVANNSLEYCQGMNYIVGFLVYAFREEEICLKIFEKLFENYNLSKIYGNNLRDLDSIFYSIDSIISHLHPQVQYHLKSESVTSRGFASSWIISLFTLILQNYSGNGIPKLLLAIWDAFLIDKWKAIFKTILFIIEELNEDIIQSKMENIFQIMSDKTKLNSMNDSILVDKFIKKYHSIKISNKMINQIGEGFYEIKKIVKEIEEKIVSKKEKEKKNKEIEIRKREKKN